MSASAIIMMLIACIGLWGGIAVSLAIMMKSNKAKAAATGTQKDYAQEWVDAEILPDEEERKIEQAEKILEKASKKSDQ